MLKTLCWKTKQLSHLIMIQGEYSGWLSFFFFFSSCGYPEIHCVEQAHSYVHIIINKINLLS